MAHRGRAWLSAVSVILAYLLHTATGDAPCDIPSHFMAQYYSIEQGVVRYTEMSLQEYTVSDEHKNTVFEGTCQTVEVVNGTLNANGQHDAVILFRQVAERDPCYVCLQLFSRTPNVIQFRASECLTPISWLSVFEYVCAIDVNQQMHTMFRQNLETVNCKNTFEGVYSFVYEERDGGGSRCDSERNRIIACQEPGSPYVDNQIMFMQFGRCPGVQISFEQNTRYQCMGSWIDNANNMWSALADTGQEDLRFKFKCVLTRDDQQLGDNKMWYSMSRFSSCDTLYTPYDGDYRMEVKPVVYGNQLVEPMCNMARNLSGTWFTTGEFDSQVIINATHIYFKTRLDQYTYRETYFTCQQSIDTRYLMTAVTVGKCEVDYICFDILPRHHNIIRWRMGRPVRMMAEEMNQANFLERKFRQACSWNSFTIDRTMTNWTYNVFILDPPSPVDCPVAGRYKFKQIGVSSEQYFTRVEGITVRPRHQIDCREYTSEFKSCYENTKKIQIDVEYCDTVDHTGRPIGEYDIPDNELACVGFWMEDMKSYMITYDEMDAVSMYRCWVYERLDWREVIMSRSTRSICGKNQHSRSYTPAEGASLALQLMENERIYDDCPTRFNNGQDPYHSELAIFVLGGSASVSANLLVLLISVLVVCGLYR